MKMTYELWRLVAVRDEQHSTWELVGRFANVKRAKAKIYELAGTNVVSPEERYLWYEDARGTHTFRIEVVPLDEAPQRGVVG